MYRIEWKAESGSIGNSLHIDGKEYPAKCQKFAERCNFLETKVLELCAHLDYEVLSTKWIPQEEAEDILTKQHLKYFIEHGELGYSMEGNKMFFDHWEVKRLKETITGQ